MKVAVETILHYLAGENKNKCINTYEYTEDLNIERVALNEIPRVPNTIYRLTLPRIASYDPFVLTMAKFGPKNWSWNVIAHGCQKDEIVPPRKMS